MIRIVTDSAADLTAEELSVPGIFVVPLSVTFADGTTQLDDGTMTKDEFFVRLAEDISGGLMVTMPSQVDFHSDMVVGRNGETIGQICNKFFAAREGVSTENRQRIMRFIENLCLGAAAVGYRTESMHGAGSPQAQRIMIARQGNIQGKKKLAKNIAGIHK